MRTIQKIHCGFIDDVNDPKTRGVIVVIARHSLTDVRHNSIKYALTVNPIVYESCIKQFWTTAEAKIVNGEHQIQALVDKKKVIITEKSVRSDLMLEDADGTECLPNDEIFEQLTLMGPGKGFSGKVIPLFQTMMVQASKDMGEDSVTPTDSHSTPIITQPSSSKSQTKRFRRKQRKYIGSKKPIPDEATNEEPISTPSCDPPQSAKEIVSLKNRVKLLEQRRKSRTSGLKRLRKFGSASRVESSNDDSLGAQEDASKQERKIADLDADAEVTLIDKTQERNDEEMLFDVQDDLQGEEVVAEKEVSAADLVTTAGDVVTTANVEVTTASAPTTTIDEFTLAQTLIEIKAANPKAVTTAATTTTNTRPKARGVVVQEPSEFKTTSLPSQASQLPQVKYKGKAKMVEPEKPLKKKDQIAFDEELARNFEAQLQAELEEEERLSRLKEEEANIALLESWDNTQAMMDADF
ncbi:hypothetical protein Tco_0405830 [Tanacetum coccineum]